LDWIGAGRDALDLARHLSDLGLLADDEALHVLQVRGGDLAALSHVRDELDVLPEQLKAQLLELGAELRGCLDVRLQARLPLVEGLEQRHEVGRRDERQPARTGKEKS